ncbi:MAG: OB-fold domain-containing protein [Candidatus Nitrosopolaris sp.]
MESSKTRQQEQNTSPREKFIIAARRNKILSNKCSLCGHLMLVTVYYCEKCFSRKFETIELEGTGKVVTYTIQAVAPEGFEDAGSYAWVVFSVDGTDFRVSGFLPGVISSSAIPIGSRVRVSDYHPKHGLSLQKI